MVVVITITVILLFADAIESYPWMSMFPDVCIPFTIPTMTSANGNNLRSAHLRSIDVRNLSTSKEDAAHKDHPHVVPPLSSTWNYFLPMLLKGWNGQVRT